MGRFILQLLWSLFVALTLCSFVVLVVIWLIDPSFELLWASLALARELTAALADAAWWLRDRISELRST